MQLAEESKRIQKVSWLNKIIRSKDREIIVFT